MKIQELQKLEEETIQQLRVMVAAGDAKAAKVLLAHLRQVSKDISEWQKTKDRKTP